MAYKLMNVNIQTVLMKFGLRESNVMMVIISLEMAVQIVRLTMAILV